MNDIELDRLLDTWTVPAVPQSLLSGLLSRLPPPPKPRLFGIPIRWLPALAIVAALAGTAAWIVRNGVLASEAETWDAHTYVRRTRVVEPAIRKLEWMFLSSHGPVPQWRDGKLAGSVDLHSRIGDAHYGYSWNAEPLGNGQYLFHAEPLERPAVVAAGSSIEVNLYASPTERVYDRIEWSAHPMSIKDVSDPAPETVTMTFTNPRLDINARFAADSGGITQVRGLTFRIDVPGRGRFVTALYPGGNRRFTQAGSVKGSSLEFEWAGELFRVECTAPISPTGDRPVFVMLQPDAAIRSIGFSAGGAPNQYR
jgi:hypothetical protein